MSVHQLRKPQHDVKTRIEDYEYFLNVVTQIWSKAQSLGICNALAGASALSEDEELKEELAVLWQVAYEKNEDVR